jgi:hypothetical protein
MIINPVPQPLDDNSQRRAYVDSGKMMLHTPALVEFQDGRVWVE